MGQKIIPCSIQVEKRTQNFMFRPRLPTLNAFRVGTRPLTRATM